MAYSRVFALQSRCMVAANRMARCRLQAVLSKCRQECATDIQGKLKLLTTRGSESDREEERLGTYPLGCVDGWTARRRREWKLKLAAVLAWC